MWRCVVWHFPVLQYNRLKEQGPIGSLGYGIGDIYGLSESTTYLYLERSLIEVAFNPGQGDAIYAKLGPENDQ